MKKPVIRISVRSLVEFILREGDLDSRRGTGDKEAMQKGSRLHRKLQRQMGGGYRAEVPLKRDTEYEDLILRVEGRADGIFSQDGDRVIDEIKGTYKNLEHLEGPVPVHRAQALCYGWIYGEMERLEEIGIQMTYVNLDTEAVRRFQERVSMEWLKAWYESLLNEYHKWVSFQLAWRMRRNASMEGLEFPFAYREGQKKLVSSVYHAISKKRQLFIQAPTGVGKTMSAVFPAVRAVGEGKGETIFYLTARTIARTVAEEAFSILQEKGLLFKVITLTAKEKLCFLEKAECNPSACPFARGHYDRINRAVYEMWTERQSFTREVITAQAEKHQVCPFELSLDAAVWMDGVICDYNYAFDPNVHLKRFFGEGAPGNYIFLIDEAHNLVERGREMYSAVLCREDVREIKKFVRSFSPKLAKSLERVNRQLLEMKKECDSYRVLDSPGTIPLTLLQVMGEMEEILEEPPSPEAAEGILDFYFCVRDFLNVAELLDENYVVYTFFGEDGKFRIKLFCVNPAENLKTYLSGGTSAVFFSATLLPLGYYRKLLSARKDDYGVYVPSPFPREKRCILFGCDVSSRYTRRNYQEYRRIAEYIAGTAWQKKGNYMVFFPSYTLMEDVYQVYQEEFSTNWVQCICQSSSMSEREREEFLGEFREREDTLLGFCVMGGIFSEGIDLLGNRLIGAIVVGTGIPQISSEREILKDYYNKRGEDGFGFAYRCPGMNKVLQAAGRVIRTQEDVGVILLLDDRFRSGEYRALFPPEWEDGQYVRLDSVREKLKNFWEDSSFLQGGAGRNSIRKEQGDYLSGTSEEKPEKLCRGGAGRNSVRKEQR